MRKVVFSALSVTALLVATASPAQAEISQFSRNSGGVARADGTAGVGGKIKCSSSESFRVWVKLTRNGVVLKGVSPRKSCHGAPQSWRALAKHDVDKASAGRWRMCATPGDTAPDREPNCGTVTLRKG